MAWGTQTEWRREALPKPEIFSYPPSTNVIDNIVLNATGVTADASGPYTGRRYLVAGTILSKRSDTGNQYERYTGASSISAVNEVQSETVTATGGTYTLTWPNGENGPETTTALAYNAAAATIQAALRALPGIGSTGVTVTGTGPYTITFGGTLAGTPVPQLVVDATLATGGTVTMSTTTQGVTAVGAQAIAGILYDTVEFVDGTDKSDQPAAMVRRDCEFRSDKIVDYATYAGALATALPSCEFV
jgi:hypothetical protein